MAEAVVLGDLELDLVTGIAIDENRRVVVHPWPGNNGDLVQDLGMGAARIWLSGLATGEESASRLEEIRRAMQGGKPMDFTASVAVASSVEQVLATGLRVVQPPGQIDYYEYALALVQYVEPPPPVEAGFDADSLAQIELDSNLAAVEDVGGLLDEAAALKELTDQADQLGMAAALLEKAFRLVQGLGDLEKLITATMNVVDAASGGQQD